MAPPDGSGCRPAIRPGAPLLDLIREDDGAGGDETAAAQYSAPAGLAAVGLAQSGPLSGDAPFLC
jgi:hypothetical protein